MAGYTPVFDTVFQGSLCGKYPDLPVWLVLLALCQKGGVIDAHPSYIATVSGLPQADIEAAIKRFCEPDPSSRTPDHDGRRLVPIEGRGFGWYVVNHGKYNEKARLQAKNIEESKTGKNAKRMQDRRRPPETAANRPSDTDTDTDTKKKKEQFALAREVSGLDCEAWDRWLAYRRGIKKPIREVSAVEAARDMAKLGAGQAAAVAHTMAKGWTGLREPDPAKPSAPPKREREPTADEIAAARARAAAENATGIAKALKLPSLGVSR